MAARNFLINLLLGLIPELIFVGIIIKLLGEDVTFMSILWGYIALNIFLFFFWLTRTIFWWIYFYLFGRRIGADLVYKALIEKDLPTPEDYDIENPEQYLEGLLDSKNEKFREEALVSLTQIQTLRNRGQLSELLKTISVLKLALSDYQKNN